jgi:hypothetical protein
VVGDGCHEGEEEGEQKVEVGGGGDDFHIGEGTHFWDALQSSGLVLYLEAR